MQECEGMISCGGVRGETQAVTARHLKAVNPASTAFSFLSLRFTAFVFLSVQLTPD